MNKKSKKSGFDIEHVAKLARLALTDEEKKTFEPQLREVIDYFKKLQEVDIAGIEPTFHVIPGLTNRFQEQKLEADTISQKDVLKNAAAKKDGYVQTDAVL